MKTTIVLEIEHPDTITPKKAGELINRIVTMGINEARVETQHSPSVASEFYEMLEITVGQAMIAHDSDSSVTKSPDFLTG